MKVIADLDKCQGHGVCNMSCPEVFDLAEEDGHVMVKYDVIPVELEEGARLGVDSCPELALSIEE